MVDKAKLDQMLSNLRGYLAVLKRLAETPRDRFLADPDKVGNAKYHFVIAIECSIDIANHVIASEELRFPKDNADSFVALVEAGIVGGELRDPLSAMARFRNRLVHVYWDLEDAKVYQYLQDSLADLESFERAVAGRTW